MILLSNRAWRIEDEREDGVEEGFQSSSEADEFPNILDPGEPLQNPENSASPIDMSFDQDSVFSAIGEENLDPDQINERQVISNDLANEEPVLDAVPINELSDQQEPLEEAEVEAEGEEVELDSSEFEMSAEEPLPEMEQEFPRARETGRRSRRMRRGRAFLEYNSLGNPSIKRYDVLCIQNNEIVRIGDEKG